MWMSKFSKHKNSFVRAFEHRKFQCHICLTMWSSPPARRTSFEWTKPDRSVFVACTPSKTMKKAKLNSKRNSQSDVEALMEYYVMYCIAGMENFFRYFLLSERFSMIIMSMNTVEPNVSNRIIAYFIHYHSNFDLSLSLSRFYFFYVIFLSPLSSLLPSPLSVAIRMRLKSRVLVKVEPFDIFNHHSSFA